MAGPFALGLGEPDAGADAGRRAGTTLAMHATVTVANLDAFIADPKHAGRLKGSIDFSPFGSDIAASSGAFNLFSPTAKATLKHMVYELAFKHDGKDHYLAGRKQWHDGPGADNGDRKGAGSAKGGRGRRYLGGRRT